VLGFEHVFLRSHRSHPNLRDDFSFSRKSFIIGSQQESRHEGNIIPFKSAILKLEDVNVSSVSME